MSEGEQPAPFRLTFIGLVNLGDAGLGELDPVTYRSALVVAFRVGEKRLAFGPNLLKGTTHNCYLQQVRRHVCRHGIGA